MLTVNHGVAASNLVYVRVQVVSFHDIARDRFAIHMDVAADMVVGMTAQLGTVHLEIYRKFRARQTLNVLDAFGFVASVVFIVVLLQIGSFDAQANVYVWYTFEPHFEISEMTPQREYRYDRAISK